MAATLAGAAQICRWCSTICKMNCFCSSSLVKELLNCWNRSTLRSAKSFTTFTERQVSWFRLYSSRLSHSLGSCSRNSSSSFKILKNWSDEVVTKLCKLWGYLNGYIHLRGSSDPTFCRSAATTTSLIFMRYFLIKECKGIQVFWQVPQMAVKSCGSCIGHVFVWIQEQLMAKV